MRSLRITALLFLSTLFLLTLSCNAPNENGVSGTVTSIAEGDGGEGALIWIDKGSAAGIKLNQQGWVLEKGDTIATIRVDEVKPDTCRAVVLEHTPFKAVTEGLSVRFDKNGTILSPETPVPEKPCCANAPGPYVPTAGGNLARTGSYDERGVPSPTGILWKSGPYWGDIITFSPPIINGLIILGDGSRFYVVDVKTGEESFRFPESMTVYESPAVLDNTIYIPDDRFFVAADMMTGIEKWRSDVRAMAPAVSKDRVFLTSYDGTFIALDIATGKELWRIETGKETRTIPALNGDTVYFGGGDDILYAVDAKTGAVKWKYDAGDYLTSRYIVVGQDTVYVANNSYLFALDKQTRLEKWRFKIDIFLGTAPAVACDTVYIFNQGSLYALDAQTGLEKWRFNFREMGVEENGASYNPPIVVGGVVYFGGLDDSVYAVDADTGKLIWSYEMKYRTSTPVIVDGVLYVTSGPYLYAIK